MWLVIMASGRKIFMFCANFEDEKEISELVGEA